jgi:hypothetical protein
MNILIFSLKQHNELYLCKTTLLCISILSQVRECISNYIEEILIILIDLLSSPDVFQELKSIIISVIGDLFLNNNLNNYLDPIISILFSACDIVADKTDEPFIKLKENIIECFSTMLLSSEYKLAQYIPEISNKLRIFCNHNPSNLIQILCINLIADIAYIYGDQFRSIVCEKYIIDIINNFRHNSEKRKKIEWAENIIIKILNYI